MFTFNTRRNSVFNLFPHPLYTLDYNTVYVSTTTSLKRYYLRASRTFTPIITAHPDTALLALAAAEKVTHESLPPREIYRESIQFEASVQQCLLPLFYLLRSQQRDVILIRTLPSGLSHRG